MTTDILQELHNKQMALCEKHLKELNPNELAFLYEVARMLDQGRQLNIANSTKLGTLYARLEEENT